MSERLNTVLDQIEAHRREMEGVEDVVVRDDASPLDLLTAIYRDPRQPITRKMRAAIEAAPYFHPKLAVNANIS